jgi:RNA polymerase sigma factor (sigma-70 family)
MAERFKRRLDPCIACDVTDLYSIANFALFEAVQQYGPARGRFDAFARLVVWRSMRQHLRSLSANRHLSLAAAQRESTPILPDELAAQSQLGVRVGLAINKLPERVRLVMLMVYEDGISHREAANRLGITEGRLNQLHGDAIRRMRCEIVRQLGSHTLAHRKGE